MLGSLEHARLMCNTKWLLEVARRRMEKKGKLEPEAPLIDKNCEVQAGRGTAHLFCIVSTRVTLYQYCAL